MNDTTETATTPRRKAVHVAINAPTEALREAIRQELGSRLKHATFSFIGKISERPTGARLATAGLPAFIPGNEGVTVYSFGTKMENNATAESRNNQWGVLRDPESTVEEVLAELGRPQEYLVLPEKVSGELKMALSEVRLDIAEASTTEDQLAAYKAGFQLLVDAIG